MINKSIFIQDSHSYAVFEALFHHLSPLVSKAYEIDVRNGIEVHWIDDRNEIEIHWIDNRNGMEVHWIDDLNGVEIH